MARTYIILVNWNGYRDTIECLESLLRLADEDFAVIVVDNGSTDGSMREIEAWANAPDAWRFDSTVWQSLPDARRYAPDLHILSAEDALGQRPDGARITLIDRGFNAGFAAANNLGLAFAAKDDAAEYFWILNNDTVVDPASLTALVDQARARPDQGMIGAVLLYYSEPGIVQSLGGWCNPRRALAGQIGFGVSRDALPPVEQIEAQLDYVAGASMFVRRDVYAATGGMSEAYFLYYEEIDWARRMPARYRLGICYGALVYHKEGQSIGTSSRDRPSATSLYYSYASAIRFYARYERRYAPLAVGRILYNLVDHGRRRDGTAFAVTFRALADVATGRRRRGAWNSAEFRARL